MSANRAQLLDSLASLVADYALVQMTPAHIDRWVRQFDGPDGLQESILQELLFVLKSTYISEARLDAIVRRVEHQIPALHGETPEVFWPSVVMIYRPHATMGSQRTLIEKLQALVSAPLVLAAGRNSSPSNRYVFLDDVLFTGRQAEKLLENWVNHAAPFETSLEMVVLASHTSGEDWLIQELSERLHRKQASFRFAAHLRVENRASHSAGSGVLWPATRPAGDDCDWYEARLRTEPRPFSYRDAGTQAAWPFSGESGRRLLEEQFTRKGAALIRGTRSPDWNHRPLGYSREPGFGFGSMLVTYRHCANNCPLVFWWGDPSKGATLSQWYPLFPRFRPV